MDDCCIIVPCVCTRRVRLRWADGNEKATYSSDISIAEQLAEASAKDQLRVLRPWWRPGGLYRLGDQQVGWAISDLDRHARVTMMWKGGGTSCETAARLVFDRVR